MATYNVNVVRRELVTYEVEADNAEQARQRYLSDGLIVSEEPGANEIGSVELAEA